MNLITSIFVFQGTLQPIIQNYLCSLKKSFVLCYVKSIILKVGMQEISRLYDLLL